MSFDIFLYLFCEAPYYKLYVLFSFVFVLAKALHKSEWLTVWWHVLCNGSTCCIFSVPAVLKQSFGNGTIFFESFVINVAIEHGTHCPKVVSSWTITLFRVISRSPLVPSVCMKVIIVATKNGKVLILLSLKTKQKGHLQMHWKVWLYNYSYRYL